MAHLVRELKNPERDNYNETLDFTFASLAQLLDMLREPIYQHGLMLKQEFEKGDELPLEMVTTFIHIPTSTEVSFRLPAFIKEDKRLDECQRVGASFTYFRRYGRVRRSILLMVMTISTRQTVNANAVKPAL